ncbi:hypothetical protein V5799_000237 [Amblyomma americanum]|uniref:GH18 domain-containing protein n=1 Tax=Amblyomma americanum TaxID=6943 RepID=A0AAQ4D3M3_AMBAM
MKSTAADQRNLHSPYWTTAPSPRSAFSSPPRIRIVLASNAGYSAAQPYDGFAGVPAFIGAPDVIVFTPRQSPERSPQTPAATNSSNQGQSIQVYSPPAAGTTAVASPASQVDSNVTFMQVWVLCGVAMGTFALPLGLILLSYGATNGPHVSPATPITLTTNDKKATPKAPTSDPSHGVPASCLKPVRLNRTITINNSSYIRHHLPVRTRKIFCLFNSSRLGRVPLPDLTLIDMPLHYCGGIIYWSLGVAGGVVRSRVEAFDNTSGLFNLTTLLSNLGLNMTILVTVGGYPEESAQFSLLGRDAGKLARFVSSLMHITWDHGLNGVTIHWATAEPACRLPEDATTLSSLVYAIRQAYRSMGPGNSEIAVMLPAEARIAGPVIRLLAERVEWIFLETHLLTPTTGGRAACNHLATGLENLIASLQAGRNQHKICTGYSLAPWLAMGVVDRRLGLIIDRFSTQIAPDTGRAGTASMRGLCSGAPPCLLWARGSCLVLRKASRPPGTIGPIPLYVFHDESTLFRIFSHGLYTSAAHQTNQCAVLYDIDLDNFEGTCTGLNMGVFAHLTHFANIMAGQLNSTDFERNVPIC